MVNVERIVFLSLVLDLFGVHGFVGTTSSMTYPLFRI